MHQQTAFWQTFLDLTEDHLTCFLLNININIYLYLSIYIYLSISISIYLYIYIYFFFKSSFFPFFLSLLKTPNKILMSLNFMPYSRQSNYTYRQDIWRHITQQFVSINNLFQSTSSMKDQQYLHTPSVFASVSLHNVCWFFTLMLGHLDKMM